MDFYKNSEVWWLFCEERLRIFNNNVESCEGESCRVGVCIDDDDVKLIDLDQNRPPPSRSFLGNCSHHAVFFLPALRTISVWNMMCR